MNQKIRIGQFGGKLLFKKLALKALEPTSDFFKPFDYYCPSVRDQLSKRICQTCSFYIANLTAIKNHKKLHHQHANHFNRNTIDEEEDETEIVANSNTNDDSSMPLTNIFELMGQHVL